jgi:hypothetical protein
MLKWIGHHPQIILQTLIYIVGILGCGFLGHYYSSTKEEKIGSFIFGAFSGGLLSYFIIKVVFEYN